MLTNEDHLIFRRLMSVATQARYHKADRRDAERMLLQVIFWEAK